jgi:hypothetical protein
MEMGKYAAAWILFNLASVALAADPPECGGGLARPQMNFTAEAVELDKAAYAVKTRWNEEWNSIPLEDRLKRREAAIDDIYKNFGEKRKAAYQSASCLVVNTKKCASTPGHKHSCPMSIDAPSGTYYIPSTLKAIENDFDEWPHLVDQDTVNYTNKKTGNGSNTDGFSAQVAFKPALVDQWVQQEVERAQNYLTPLLRSIFIEMPKPISPQCASLGTELAKLAELRKSGALTEAEFNGAKAALTKPCL